MSEIKNSSRKGIKITHTYFSISVYREEPWEIKQLINFSFIKINKPIIITGVGYKEANGGNYFKNLIRYFAHLIHIEIANML